MKLFSIFMFLTVCLLSASCEEDNYSDDFVQTSPYSARNKQKGTDSMSTTSPFDNPEIVLYANNGRAHQSAAVFGHYVFLLTKSRNNLYVYDLEQRKVVCSQKMEEAIGTTYYGTDLYHCNQASFGVDYYEEEDQFPLLYVSQRSGYNLRCFAEVFRVKPNQSEDAFSYTSIDLGIVQTIHFPPMTSDNSMGNVNCVIDHERHLLYTYSRNNQKEDDNYGECKISCFQIPNVHQTEVYLEDTDLVESYMVDCKALNMQGGCIKDGLLYVGQGYSSVGYIYLNVIDLLERKLVAKIDLYSRGIRWEPEGLFWYDGTLHVSSNDCNIWKIIFADQSTGLNHVYY